MAADGIASQRRLLTGDIFVRGKLTAISKFVCRRDTDTLVGNALTKERYWDDLPRHPYVDQN
jgi:hypothetical protein